jgi:hypothetical protein
LQQAVGDGWSSAAWLSSSPSTIVIITSIRIKPGALFGTGRRRSGSLTRQRSLPEQKVQIARHRKLDDAGTATVVGDET